MIELLEDRVRVDVLVADEHSFRAARKAGFVIPTASLDIIAAESRVSIGRADPYYPATGQPFSLSEEELVESWTGVIVLPRR